MPATPCSFGLSATSQQYFSLRTNQPPETSQQYFSLRTNQPPETSQQYFSLRTNQHQPSATSQTNRLYTLPVHQPRIWCNSDFRRYPGESMLLLVSV
jgi:hypothetical protein